MTSGTTQDISGLRFDPAGADFTQWTQHAKNELFRNWIIPQIALLGGIKGHVVIEFTVERDGSVSSVVLLRSAGNPALDRSSGNAILASRFRPLPSDYAPRRITFGLTFYYNEGPA